MENQLNELIEAVKDLYLSVGKLRAAFNERLFTPDGRMVGDIGEAIAKLKYSVELDKKSKQHWDGYRIRNGKHQMVQIKTTQKDETYLKEPPEDGNLLVFKIYEDGHYECCYDGSVMAVWKSLKNKKPDKTGAKFIQLRKLKELGDKSV